MARKVDARLLDNGDPFPNLRLPTVNGGSLLLPDDLRSPFSVVLVTRGSWCPFCNGQLKAFQAGLPKLAAEGIAVVALSSDSLEQAQSVVAEHQLEFPVFHSAPVELLARALGAYYEPEPSHTQPYLHATGFVLGPDHRVITAVYSSGAIGRLLWQDVLGLVQYVKSKH